MSTFNPHRAAATALFAAVNEWRDKCLINDGSLFSEHALWTPPHFEELRETFIDRPDETSDPFIDKLKRQISDLPAASQLMAEMLWVMNLFPSNIGPTSKRNTVLTVWNWSGELLPPEHPYLDPGLITGIGSAGPGFLAHRWRELRFFINAMRDFKSKTKAQRLSLLEPWEFAQWLDDVPDVGYRQLKHILPFMLFPEQFERISSPGDIRKILIAVGG